MSMASRARETARIEKANAKTPEWARDQIARQGKFFSARKAYAQARECTIEKVSARMAYARAMSGLAVIFTAKAKAPELGKLQLRTKA